MKQRAMETFLVDHPFFKDLNPGFLKLIAGCATNVYFEAGAYIFREGDEAKHFYALRDGQVALEISAAGLPAITIQTLEGGDLLGWSWLVPPYKKQFSARVVSATRALSFDGECLRRKCEQDPTLGYELLKRFTRILGERLQATRLQLLDVYAAGH